MITGFGASIASVCVFASGAITGVADAEGQFLTTDNGSFFATSTGQFLLTNVEIKTLQTGTSLDFATSSGDTLISFRADGEATSAPDPE